MITNKSSIKQLYYIEDNHVPFNYFKGISIIKIDDLVYKITEEEVKQLSNFEVINLDGLIIASALQNKRIYKNSCSLSHITKIIKEQLYESFMGCKLTSHLIDTMRKDILSSYGKFIGETVATIGVHENSDRCTITNIIDNSNNTNLIYKFKLNNLDFYDSNFEIQQTIQIK